MTTLCSPILRACARKVTSTRASSSLYTRSILSSPVISHFSTTTSFSQSPSSSSSFQSRHKSRPTTSSSLNFFTHQQQQIRCLTQNLRSAIDTAVKSAPVVLFMKGTPGAPQCGFSRASVQVLAHQGVDPAKFAAFNVLEDAELRTGIKEYTDWQTIPQLFIDGEFVGGCDILMSMHQDGSLMTLLTEKGVLVQPAVTDEGNGESSSSEKPKE